MCTCPSQRIQQYCTISSFWFLSTGCTDHNSHTTLMGETHPRMYVDVGAHTKVCLRAFKGVGGLSGNQATERFHTCQLLGTKLEMIWLHGLFFCAESCFLVIFMKILMYPILSVDKIKCCAYSYFPRCSDQTSLWNSGYVLKVSNVGTLFS